MPIPLKRLPGLLILAVSAVTAAESRKTWDPAGWTITAGAAATTADLLKPANPQPLKLVTETALPLPIEARFVVRLPDPRSTVVLTLGEDEPLTVELRRRDDGLLLQARDHGQPMATDAVSQRTWSRRRQTTGNVSYQLRFPRIRNTWDDGDRRDIGAANEQLLPPGLRRVVVRLAVTAEHRQIWVDDQLLAEDREPSTEPLRGGIELRRDAEVLSVQFTKPHGAGRFMPLWLDDWAIAVGAGRDGQREPSIAWRDAYPGATGPLTEPPRSLRCPEAPDIDLGATLYRYRLTHGTGPRAPYVNALRAWPSAFELDPARPRLRVPYREYQNLWLFVSVDDDAHEVPRGTVRFYRPLAGYAATSEFSVPPTPDDDVVAAGALADGRTVYRVRVPVDTDAFYGFSDMADQFLELELSKPVSLSRSYPDPIYYGAHPAGPPSSLHVHGIVLEEAAFSYRLTPKQTAHVFEQPTTPGYQVQVRNQTVRVQYADVRLRWQSYDRIVTGTTTQSGFVPAGGTATFDFQLAGERLGWYELKTTVNVGTVQRGHTAAFVVLPINSRTYGNSLAETRFGAWNLFGHYTAFEADPSKNLELLELLRKLGVRRIGFHGSFVDPQAALKLDFLPKGPHTIHTVYRQTDENDPESMQQMLEKELAQTNEVLQYADSVPYYYGGEWSMSHDLAFGQNPRYTGQGPRRLTEAEAANTARQTKLFTAIGETMRRQAPSAKLVLQWGAPLLTPAFMAEGFPQHLVDAYGMDAPMFELRPEVPTAVGNIHGLWQLREEAKRLGWPQLPIYWCEGPFLPTNPGALSEREQAEHYVRYYLIGLAYGIGVFEAGVVPFDAGNYYGAEHYGAGVFHRPPLAHPKPAVAAIATATAMLCGAEVIGPVSTGVRTTYCLAFKRPRQGDYLYALWRSRGEAPVTLAIAGGANWLADMMGNLVPTPTADAVTCVVSTAPIWLSSDKPVTAIDIGRPQYDDPQFAHTVALTPIDEADWIVESRSLPSYADNHFAVHRVYNPEISLTFGERVPGLGYPALTVNKKPQLERMLAIAYRSLRARKPMNIPGKATALGLLVEGNASWGRIIFQLRDAKDEIWTSIGTKDDWNCDDVHGWSYIDFEGWRQLTFPLPGNHPWDAARELDSTWWKSEGGDGIVDLPLRVERLICETRDFTNYLGKPAWVFFNTYRLGRLTALYDDPAQADDAVQAAYARRRPTPEWQGPQDNPYAELQQSGVGAGPAAPQFIEPHHWNDGRRMVIQFAQQANVVYNLYLSLYADGRGAELLAAKVADNTEVRGFRPEQPVYLFLTKVVDGTESQPSGLVALTTHDRFAEK